MTRCALKFELVSVTAITVPEHRARELQPDVVDQLAESLEREGQINPISVRETGDGTYMLVTGLHRLRATAQNGRSSVQCSIWSPDTPDDVIRAQELVENLWRAELSPTERQASIVELAALTKTESKPGQECPTLGGRGNKGVATAVAGRVGVTKRSVNQTIQEASEQIGEPISLANDSPAELEAKANKIRTVARSGRWAKGGS